MYYIYILCVCTNIDKHDVRFFSGTYGFVEGHLFAKKSAKTALRPWAGRWEHQEGHEQDDGAIFRRLGLEGLPSHDLGNGTSPSFQY